jgi:uncharacterized protein YkvS
MIVSFTGYSQTYSNDSTVLVPVSQLRRASELILEGKLCQDNEIVLNALIENKDVQIAEMQAVRQFQDSLISNFEKIEVNQDSIIVNKDEIIELKDKQIGKMKLIAIGSVVLLALSLIL